MTQHVDIHIKIRLKGKDIDDADTKRAVEYHTAGLAEALLLPDPTGRRVKVKTDTSYE